MVTGIPKTVLVGEPVTGLNSSGENELSLFYAMIEGLQDRYIINPFNDLLEKLGMGKAIMKRGLGDPDRIAGFEGVVLSNAQTLMDLGEDYKQYLVNKGLAEVILTMDNKTKRVVIPTHMTSAVRENMYLLHKRTQREIEKAVIKQLRDGTSTVFLDAIDPFKKASTIFQLGTLSQRFYEKFLLKR